MAIATTIAPANTELLTFAEMVVTLSAQGFNSDQINALYAPATIVESPAPMPTTVSKPRTVKQTTPATKRTRKPADVKAAPNLVATKNGGMMDSTPGSSTKGQIAKMVALIEKYKLDPFTAEEITEMERMSMAQMSDYRYDIIADIKSAA